MNTVDNWEVEWLVALLAPWTVSPHPNFRDDDVSGAAALALVTEMRDLSEGYDLPSKVGVAPGWRDSLIASASRALIIDTQAESIDELLQLAQAKDVPPGARAAAALYGCVALCEMERHAEAIDSILALLDDLEPAVDGRTKHSATQQIIIATLQLQLSARLTESCEFDEARNRVELTLKWLPTLRDASLQNFVVSDGISWSASTVQRDLIRSVTSHALSLKSYLEQIGGHTWVRVVRGRTNWVDSRRHLRSADRDEVVLRDAFERRIEANSNAVHFGRISADAAGYRSLILAELSGHLGSMRGERESLGKVLILEQNDDPERVREALRLLRQGRATKALQATITWIRAQGPSVSLVDDAVTVISRIERLGWCTEQDLMVLEGASDFLSPRQRNDAVSAALMFAGTPKMQREMSWSSWERLWKTISRLVPASGRNNDIASLAFDYIEGQEFLSQPITNTLARLVSSLEWNVVESDVSAKWMGLTETIARDFDTSVLLDAIDEQIRGTVRSVPIEVGLERAAYLADAGLLEGDTGATVTELTSHLSELIRKEVDDAAKGMMSLGGYQTANVAVAFALRFPSDVLWNDIVDHLLDTRVDINLKNHAVDRIAENVIGLPSNVSTRLTGGIQQLLASERHAGIFEQAGSSSFSEAIRLSAALRATPRSELLETILRLTTAGVKDRIQAAKTIPFGMSKNDATWGHALLLQLSHDPDPSVRAAAGQALVRSLSATSDLGDAVYARIVSLLQSDGIKVPLAVLHAVQRSARTHEDDLTPLLSEIKRLTAHGGNSLTQGAAKICVDILSGRERGNLATQDGSASK